MTTLLSPRLVELDTVGSTNDYAKDLARGGAEEGTLVCAHEQTAGRGRRGNQWTSSRGNLFMSLLLRPQAVSAQAGQLSFLAAVALAQTVQAVLPRAALALKWPNDVLLNGQKLAGILLETEAEAGKPLPWVVVGIGVNVMHAPAGAVSLHAAGGHGITAAHLRDRLAKTVLALYARWQAEGFEWVRADWLERAYRLGEWMEVRLPQESFSAVFSGLDAQGALLARLADGQERKIHSGEVYFT